MMSNSLRSLSGCASAFIIALSLAGAPALAEKGNGKGGGNGNGGQGGAPKSETASKADKRELAGKPSQKVKVQTASAAGKLNGFFHASPKALANASPKSSIGKISKVYAGLLGSYLAPAAGATPPTIEQVAASLASATNKQLTKAQIAAINAKLVAANPELAESLASSGKTPESLAAEIAAAL